MTQQRKQLDKITNIKKDINSYSDDLIEVSTYDVQDQNVKLEHIQKTISTNNAQTVANERDSEQ